MKIKLTVSSYGFSDRLQHISVVVHFVSLHHVSQPHLSSNCPSGSICRLSPVGCMQRERRGVPPCSTSRGSLDCPGILPGALPKLYLHCRLTGKEGSVCKRGGKGHWSACIFCLWRLFDESQHSCVPTGSWMSPWSL